MSLSALVAHHSVVVIHRWHRKGGEIIIAKHQSHLLSSDMSYWITCCAIIKRRLGQLAKLGLLVGILLWSLPAIHMHELS